MTSPITDAMVEAARAKIKERTTIWLQTDILRFALEAALPSALAERAAARDYIRVLESLARKQGFAAGVEAAVRLIEGAPVKEPNKIALIKVIRALRPPAAPAESGPDLGLSDGDVRFPPPLSASEPAGVLADMIVQEVAELSNRTSPEDWPEAMLVTADELRAIVISCLTDVEPAEVPPRTNDNLCN